MAPKKGQKRKAPGATSKAAAAASSTTNADTNLTPPDRETWPGWVEMESEPAFFNVMLDEMGAQGVKIKEVYSMDATELAILPHPVHALIFLFRYKTSLDQQVQSEEKPKPDYIWFANQIPDFACASVALLNIVNNIPGLQMGKELRDFKDFSQDLDPYNRGLAIDTFDFVRRIHNSFARDSDLLQADTHMKNKMAVYKRKEAAAKGRATKAAKKAAALAAPLQEKSANTTSRSGRTTQRSKKAAEDAEEVASKASSSAEKSTRSRKSSIDLSSDEDALKLDVKKAKRKSEDPDGDFNPDAKKPKTKPSTTEEKIEEEADGETDPVKTNGIKDEPAKDDSANNDLTKDDSTKDEPDKNELARDEPNGIENATGDSKEASSDSPQTNGIDKPAATNARRSTRARKPPKSFTKDPDSEAEEEEPEEGFHFIAYMPIGDHVWKLDGLNYLPEDMGTFGSSRKGADGGTGNWLDAASPAIMNRMADFAGASIEFNLMAVVHDPAIEEKSDLVQNVKALQTVEKKLTAVVEDWHEMEGGETKRDVVKGFSPEFSITQVDIDQVSIPASIAGELEAAGEDGLVELLGIRTRLLGQQDVLRSEMRNALTETKADREKAMHRRHSYTPFLRKWMGALAESEVLESLVD